MKELATALAKAQAAMKPALKDSTNPHFKSKYADLTSVWEACRDALTKNGLSVAQVTEFDGEQTWIRTILLHSSGEQLEGRYPLRPVQNTPQGMGSAISYARRYALAAMVGVVADDDDGQAASTGCADERPPLRAVESPASTMAGRKVEADGARNAREFVNAEALPALAAMKTKADLDKWLKTHDATLNGIKKAFPEQYEALDARISKTLDRVHPLAAG